MSRWIDADALELPYGYCEDASLCYEALRLLPSIDIVRCGECKYGEYRADFDDYECRYSGCGLVYKADDFCSYGERSSE